MPTNTLGWAAVGIFGLSGVLLGALAFVVSRYREARGTREFAVLLVLTSIWSLSAATKIVAPQWVEQVLVSMEIVYGVLFAVAFLTFAAEYTGQSFHRSRTFAVAVAAYLLVVLVTLGTNPSHGLLWSGLGEISTGFEHVVFVERGLLYWVLIGVSYVLYGAGVYFLLDLHLRSRFNTSALLLIVIGGLMPILVNLASLVDEFLVTVEGAPKRGAVLHGTYNKPGGYGVDTELIWTNYYLTYTLYQAVSK
jgi:hypothetical protein